MLILLPLTSAGVPHIVLPQWIDTYSYATTTEYCGLGIWASKETSPAWDSQMLVDGFLTMLVGEEGKKIRSKAKAVGEISRGYGGSRCAADIVADLAGKGSDD
jgi:UDP:flavonoid glycosyltransferase YjiC (YdhE family)